MQLIRYDAACRALAECKAVDEVKDLRDKAAAMQAYAKQAKNYELEVDAAEIRIRAERRLGQLIKDGQESGEVAGRGQPKVMSTVTTLNDAGISRDLSSRAQHIAAIPEPVFEQTLAEHRDAQKAVTGRTMQKLQRQSVEYAPPPSRDDQQDYDALITLWNRVSEGVRKRFVDAVGRSMDPQAPAAGPAVWSAYAGAYQARYGVEPVRNATTNGQIANLIKRIGGFDAPHVAAFYVDHNNSFYVMKGHSIGCLLADCEKLRMEWATNHRVTSTLARQKDANQAQGDVWNTLITEAENARNA